MKDTNIYPDGLDQVVLSVIEQQVSDEIGSRFEPTSALLDGTARTRRNRRIMARHLNRITADYGVTLDEAVRQFRAELRCEPQTPGPRMHSAGRVDWTEAA